MMRWSPTNNTIGKVFLMNINTSLAIYVLKVIFYHFCKVCLRVCERKNRFVRFQVCIPVCMSVVCVRSASYIRMLLILMHNILVAYMGCIDHLNTLKIYQM